MAWFRRETSGLLPYDAMLGALGRDHDMGTYADEVSVSAVVGSVARTQDFDAAFRPRRGTARLDEARRRLDSGRWPPPVDLLRLGELYFVVDGHHRVAVARERRWTTLPANVRRICTVAYARCCLRAVDLEASAAERRFLDRLPLPDDVRRRNWLDDPADWSRIADAAMAWGFRRVTETGGTYCCAADLAAAWWEQQVVPVVRTWREGAGVDADQPDLQVFVAALARRDGLGRLDWDDPADAQVPCC